MGQTAPFASVPTAEPRPSVETRFHSSLVKEVHLSDVDDERPPERSSRGAFRPKSRGLHSEGHESNACGGTVAKRTNYGFEKRQRELRKQKKKQEKAERSIREEATSPLPDGGEAADETPPDTQPHDDGHDDHHVLE